MQIMVKCKYGELKQPVFDMKGTKRGVRAVKRRCKKKPRRKK